MRILYISNEYPPETGFGGIGTYCRSMARGMALLGNEVHVVARSIDNIPRLQLDGPVQIHRISSGEYPLPSHKFFFLFRKICRRLLPHSLVRLAWSRQVFFTYLSLQKDIGEFDIVEFPECGAEGFYFRKLKKTRKTIFLARLHTPWELVSSLNKTEENPVENRLLSFMEKQSVGFCRGVSCPTRALAEFVKEQWRVKHIEVFPNPICTDEYELTNGSDWIYTGRIEYRKGIHVLIEAYAKLNASEKPPKLRLIGRPFGSIGDKDYAIYIQDLIEKFDLSKNIEWIRGTDHQSIKTFLLQSEVAIFPSLWENLAYSCLEAMACGCVAVASRCGGFPEMITHEHDGILFESQNSDDLAQALYRILKNPSLRDKLRHAARETIKIKYDQAIVCKLASDWYNSQTNKDLNA